jgi:hypothetical protein
MNLTTTVLTSLHDAMSMKPTRKPLAQGRGKDAENEEETRRRRRKKTELAPQKHP